MSAEAYRARVFDEVAVHPGADAFSRIAGGSIGGRPLSRLEMIGMGNLILAGGRDAERFGGSDVPVHFHALPIEVGA